MSWEMSVPVPEGTQQAFIEPSVVVFNQRKIGNDLTEGVSHNPLSTFDVD